MDEPKDQNSSADGQSVLTDGLGDTVDAQRWRAAKRLLGEALREQIADIGYNYQINIDLLMNCNDTDTLMDALILSDEQLSEIMSPNLKGEALPTTDGETKI